MTLSKPTQTGSGGLLGRILETPDLVAVVQSLGPRMLYRLVEQDINKLCSATYCETGQCRRSSVYSKRCLNWRSRQNEKTGRVGVGDARWRV
jgi:hypothetical protein